ncbi:MAG: prolipoprotein diacylglyceryl transferase [Chitinophagales bacterium]
MKAVLFSLGPFHVYRYGAAVAAGLFAGLWLAHREARRRGLDAEAVFDLCLAAILAGVAGARLEHVLFSLPFYVAHPAELFRLDEGGLSVHGALLAGGLTVWLLGRRRGLPFLRVADALVPSLALGEALGRLGCDLIGRPGRGPFPLVAEGVSYHNVPLYSATFLFGLFLYLRWACRRWEGTPGRAFLAYVLWYSAGRFVLEFFRTSPPLWHGLSLAQLASVLLAGGAAFGIAGLRKRSSP